MTIMTPPLALGQAVHDAIESLATLPVDKRQEVPLYTRLNLAWQKISGDKGGFDTEESELQYRKRAEAMIERIQSNFAVLLTRAVRIKPREEDGRPSNMDLPQFVLSKSDNIKLCGKIDWLSFDEDTQSVQIIDFKTGKNEEDSDSLQLPIYYLIAKYCQKYPVTKLSYWYLETDTTPKEMALPKEDEARERILKLALQIKKIREENSFDCPRKGCFGCLPYESILQGRGKLVGRSSTGQDVYVLTPQKHFGQSVVLMKPVLGDRFK